MTPKKDETPLPIDEAEKDMQGAEIPEAWPCGCKTPADCDHVDQTLKGRIVDFSDSDGMRKSGHIDVASSSEQTRRFWFNQNSKTVIEAAMKRADIAPDSLVGASVAIKFDKWVKTRSGYHTKTYLIGLASAD